MPYKNPSDLKKRNKKYYANNRARIIIRATAWAKENLERSREIKRLSRVRCYKGITQKDRDRASEWYLKNKERRMESNRKWSAKNQDKIHINAKRWRNNNRDKRHEWAQARRARKRNAFVERVNRKRVFNRAGGICGICSKPIDGGFEIDHILPLSKGGEHSYGNCQPAHPSCNRRKGAKIGFRFR